MTRDNKLLALALFLWGLGEGLFIYIQPLALKQLGADPVAIGSILALAGLAAACAHIPAGFLADRFGRKPLMVSGWICGLLASLLMFFAQDLRLFVPGLVFYTFTGFMIAPLNAYVAEARGQQSVQRALTLVAAGFWGGTIVSPAIGGLIARSVGLRAVFGVSSIIFLVSTVVVGLIAPQAKAALVTGSRRYGALFKNRQFVGYMALVFVAVFAFQVGLPFMPNFIVEVRGYDVALVGLLGSASSIGTVTFNLVFGQRQPRRGFILGQVLMMVSFALLLTTRSQPLLFAAYFFRSGWSLAHNMAAAQVSRVVTVGESGLALGVNETMSAMAAIVGPVLAGVLYKRGSMLPFQLSLALIALTLPLVWRYAPRLDAHSTQASAAPSKATLS